MKSVLKTGIAIVFLLVPGVSFAQEIPELPKPQKEHEWLQKLVGEWEVSSEAHVEPDKEPIKCQGKETIRSLGGFWTVGDLKSEMMGMTITGHQTLGYDPQKSKFVGTWVDSCNSYLWQYEGTLDPSGKVLTLETEGPCPTAGGKMAKFKEVLEFKSDHEKVFTSSMLGEDGKWVPVVTMRATRKK